MEFIEVGEVATFDGKKVKCVKSKGYGCDHCVFEGDCSPRTLHRPACMAHERPDKTSVYFLGSK
jgi:hypothetical protein